LGNQQNVTALDEPVVDPVLDLRPLRLRTSKSALEIVRGNPLDVFGTGGDQLNFDEAT
jgi:hypothetical protein